MIELVFIPLGLAVLIAGFAGIHVWRQFPVSWVLLGAIALLELLLIGQLIWAGIAMGSHPGPIDGVTFVAYLITAVVIPPIITLWGLSDRSRWGTGVIALGMLTTAILCFRIWAIWTG